MKTLVLLITFSFSSALFSQSSYITFEGEEIEKIASKEYTKYSFKGISELQNQAVQFIYQKLSSKEGIIDIFFNSDKLEIITATHVKYQDLENVFLDINIKLINPKSEEQILIDEKTKLAAQQ